MLVQVFSCGGISSRGWVVVAYKKILDVETYK